MSDIDAPPAATAAKVKKRTVNRTVKPYNYQQEAIDAVFAAFEDKGPADDVRIAVCAPTGSGKTIMMLAIVRELWNMAAKKGDARKGDASDGEDSEDEGIEVEEDRPQVLILVPSIQIAAQLKSEANRVMNKHWKMHCTVELEQGNSVSNGDAELIRQIARSTQEVDRKRFGLVIVDECHHAASPHFMRVLHYFNECVPLGKDVTPIHGLRHGHCTKMIGFSATPDRSGPYKTTSAFPHRIHTVETKPLINMKRLSKLSYKMIDGGLNIVELLKSCNEHEQDMSGWTAKDRENKLYEKCNAAIINEQQARWAEGRKYTLVFVARLRQLYSLKVAFAAIEVDVEFVTGATPKEKRTTIIERFKDGKTPVLINCGALVEGADLPCIDCVVLARPTKSKILVTQMIGRGMRISKETDKDDCLIIDFTVSSQSGLKRFPDLYALVNDLGSSKARATKPRAKLIKAAAGKAVPVDRADKVPKGAQIDLDVVAVGGTASAGCDGGKESGLVPKADDDDVKINSSSSAVRTIAADVKILDIADESESDVEEIDLTGASGSLSVIAHGARAAGSRGSADVESINGESDEDLAINVRVIPGRKRKRVGTDEGNEED